MCSHLVLAALQRGGDCQLAPAELLSSCCRLRLRGANASLGGSRKPLRRRQPGHLQTDFHFLFFPSRSKDFLPHVFDLFPVSVSWPGPHGNRCDNPIPADAVYNSHDSVSR